MIPNKGTTPIKYQTLLLSEVSVIITTIVKMTLIGIRYVSNSFLNLSQKLGLKGSSSHPISIFLNLIFIEHIPIDKYCLKGLISIELS